MNRSLPPEAERPFVSVVIPCFNSRHTLAECLCSLQAQQYPTDHIEIIVADNGSSDGSPELVETSFPTVRLVRTREKGSGYARNAGIAVATGELILSTDADCVAEPTWISEMVRAFGQTSEKTATIGGRIAPFAQSTPVERFLWAWVSQPHVREPRGRIRYTATPNAGYRPAALRAVGGFDGTLGFDDTDLGIRLAAAGFEIAYTDAAVVRHRNPVTLRELYRHRFKYGRFGFSLAGKHPHLLGDPKGPFKRMGLLAETLWRTLKDLVRLPASLVFPSRQKPMGWPCIDAVMAWGNYMGFRSASLAAEAGGS